MKKDYAALNRPSIRDEWAEAKKPLALIATLNGLVLLGAYYLSLPVKPTVQSALDWVYRIF